MGMFYRTIAAFAVLVFLLPNGGCASGEPTGQVRQAVGTTPERVVLGVTSPAEAAARGLEYPARITLEESGRIDELLSYLEGFDRPGPRRAAMAGWHAPLQADLHYADGREVRLQMNPTAGLWRVVSEERGNRTGDRPLKVGFNEYSANLLAGQN